MVELRARFDEQNNIDWSKQLEDAGLHRVLRLRRLQGPFQADPYHQPRQRPI